MTMEDDDPNLASTTGALSDIEPNVFNQEDENITVIEADKSELLEKTAQSEQEAYDLYNDYAFLKGFSIRRSKQRKRANQTDISSKQYCCSNEGLKRSKGKCFAKRDFRTDCKAMINFHVDATGVYTVTKHHMIHNHKLCPENKRHLLRSQKHVRKEVVELLLQLVDRGVKLSDGLNVVDENMVLVNNGLKLSESVKLCESVQVVEENRESPLLRYPPSSFNNEIARDKKNLEGSDAHALIQIFMRRKELEEDFFFDFQLDEEGRFRNFFCRDEQMKKDYDVFRDSVLYDTTHRSNRYDMFCVPFVGMNHRGKNVMFGCGFVLDENLESFVWLFKTFLKSMDGKQPTTLVTDHSAPMAAAIEVVFDKSHHMLCAWHLLENSKIHIRHLRALKGFVERFGQVLKHAETVAEFDLNWTRFLTDYQCEDNDWLVRLYNSREKWCPVFWKEHFWGGILSFQRSETTYKSISRKLYATAGLCNSYSCFIDVINEWRSNEDGEDFRRPQGNLEMIANDINILVHARRVYTIELYYLFEEQFFKSLALHQQLQEKNDDTFVFLVGKASKDQTRDLVQHVVTFDQKEKNIFCTCQMYSRVGLLCSHCLRILNYHCVDDIPKQYILKRWTKGAIATASKEQTVSTSVWRTQMKRKFSELISTSQCNSEASQYLEEAYQKVKQLATAETGCNSIEEPENVHSEIGTTVNQQISSVFTSVLETTGVVNIQGISNIEGFN